MPEYRYHLAKWNERDKALRCPGCGKGHGCYKEYLDEQGRPVDQRDHLCGKCDHENSCGYHMTPSEYYRLNPEERQNAGEWQRAEQRQKLRIEIPRQMVIDSRTAYERNVFVTWLRNLPWEEDRQKHIHNMLQLYSVGTTRDGGTIWWQIDDEFIVRTGKKMLYRPDGHRAKDEEGNSIGFNWIHSLLRRQGQFPEEDYDLVQCLFGLHLTKAFPDAEVHVVESEKTALIMSICDAAGLGKRVWLATGGLYNLRSPLFTTLTKRQIILYPDTNGVEKWAEKAEQLGVKKYTINTDWMRSLTEQDPKGADIADVAVRRLQLTDEAVWQEMKRENEAVAKLADVMGLERI